MPADGSNHWPLRRVLFLQGPPGRFWRELGQACRSAGFGVYKINLCLAEELTWSGTAERADGCLDRWPDWLAGYCERYEITDVIYYADRLPYHVAAAKVAEALGIRAWVLENGYLRPDWLTFEPFGMSAFSRLPTGAACEELAQQAGELDLAPRYSHGFWQESAAEILYGLAQALGALRYPAYRTDRYYHPLQDYLSWGLRAGQWAIGSPTRRRLLERIERREIAFTLLALQLQSDYQIRACSPYDHLSEMLEEVIASFAASAPATRHLVIKGHPLDNGWENWPRQIARIARVYGVEDRVHWLDGGSLDQMLDQAEGLITVNSTVGLKAILAGCPVIALGGAIYDRPGLTHQRGLSTFWNHPNEVDLAHRDRFLRALVVWGQVRGSFYDPNGRTNAIQEIVNRLKMGHFISDRKIFAANAMVHGNSDVP